MVFFNLKSVNEYCIYKNDLKITNKTVIRINDKRELKLLLFFDLYNEKNPYDAISELFIDKDLYESLEKDKDIENNDTIVFLYGTISIAEGKITSCGKKYRITKIKIYEEEGKVETGKSDISSIFERGDISDCEFHNYIDNMIRLYYDYLVKYAQFYDNSDRPNKLSGMITYLSFSEYVKNKGLYISTPNSYIKNFGQEFDALLLKKNTKNKYIYDLQEVLAVVEIKTAGVNYTTGVFKSQFFSNIIIPYLSNGNCSLVDNVIEKKINETKKEFDEFRKDIKARKKKLDNNNELSRLKEEESEIKDNFKEKDNALVNEYLERIKEMADSNEVIRNNLKKLPPFIYFCSHERIGTTDNAYNYYEGTTSLIDTYNKTLKTVSNNSAFPIIYPLFQTVKKHNDIFVIPDSKYTDFDEVIKSINKNV